jgi:hypothetical protein
LEAVIPLAIEISAQPGDANKPIPCKMTVAKDKLLAKSGLSETKVILGWHFNFRPLTISTKPMAYIDVDDKDIN